jgi:hypothetical protein
VDFFCYSLYSFVTMEPRRVIIHHLIRSLRDRFHRSKNLKFLILFNLIEFTYDSNKGRRCKTKGHTQRQFNKLYVIPCVKTLSCQYFKDMFINISLYEELVVSQKQQYYKSFCHKIYEECLERLHLECSDHIACPYV